MWSVRKRGEKGQKFRIMCPPPSDLHNDLSTPRAGQKGQWRVVPQTGARPRPRAFALRVSITLQASSPPAGSSASTQLPVPAGISYLLQPCVSSCSKPRAKLVGRAHARRRLFLSVRRGVHSQICTPGMGWSKQRMRLRHTVYARARALGLSVLLTDPFYDSPTLSDLTSAPARTSSASLSGSLRLRHHEHGSFRAKNSGTGRCTDVGRQREDL